jgi:hypothetical protein
MREELIVPRCYYPWETINSTIAMALMLVTHGRERTAAEFDCLFKQTGFRMNKIIELRELDLNLIETVRI